MNYKLPNRIDYKNYYIILLALYTLLPFIILLIYNQPSADDYSYTNSTLRNGFFTSQYMWYTGWTGRYTASALLGLNPLAFYSIPAYKIYSALILFFLSYALYFFVESIFGKEYRKNNILITLLLLVVYFIQMPKVASGIYWFAGAGTYQYGNIFTLFMFGNLIKYLRRNKTKHLVYSIIFLFLLIGTNETVMLIVDAILVYILLLQQIYGHNQFFAFNKQNKSLTLSINTVSILILLAIVFSLIVILAPGNSVRESYFVNAVKTRSFTDFYESIKHHFTIWTISLAIVSILITSLVNKDMLKKVKIFSIHPIYSLMIALSTIVLGFAPGFWSLGQIPPERTINIIYFFYMISWVYFSFTLWVYFSNKETEIHPKYILYIMMIAFSIQVMKSDVVKTAYSDLLSGKARKYNKELEDRYKLLKQHTPNDSVIIPKLKYKPKTIFFNDIHPKDTNDWKNLSFSEYWNIKSVKLK